MEGTFEWVPKEIKKERKTHSGPKHLLSNDTAEQYCSGCHPPGYLWLGRQYHPTSLWRCSSAVSLCHVAATRSSRHPPQTGHSPNHCFQTGRHGHHSQAAPWWLTGNHSAGFYLTFFSLYRREQK